MTGLVVGGLVLLVGAGIGAYLLGTSVVDAGNQPDSTETAPADEPSKDRPELGPSPPKPEPRPAQPGPDPSVGAARVRPCPAARGVQIPSLRTALQASGWSISGKLLYCPGNMVNFRCVGVSSDGLTTNKGDYEGSVALLRFESSAAADAYVARETRAVTLAQASPVVLRIEMPEQEADQLLARICR